MRELRIDADADVAGVVRMAVVEDVLEAEGAAHRQLPALGEALERQAESGVQPLPPTMTNGRSAAASRSRRLAERLRRRRASAGSTRSSTAADVAVASMSSGSDEHDRPGPALHRGAEGARDVLRQAIGVVHLADPLGEAQRPGPEHLPVVDLLERLAIALARSRPGRRAGSSASSPGTRCARRSPRCSRRGRA